MDEFTFDLPITSLVNLMWFLFSFANKETANPNNLIRFRWICEEIRDLWTSDRDLTQSEGKMNTPSVGAPRIFSNYQADDSPVHVFCYSPIVLGFYYCCCPVSSAFVGGVGGKRARIKFRTSEEVPKRFTSEINQLQGIPVVLLPVCRIFSFVIWMAVVKEDPFRCFDSLVVEFNRLNLIPIVAR